MARKALRPNYFGDFREITTVAEPKKKEDEDIHLHKLSESAGWGILNGYIDNLKSALDNLLTERMEAGATKEELGDKLIAVTLTKEFLSKVQNKVQDAREAVESGDRE